MMDLPKLPNAAGEKHVMMDWDAWKDYLNADDHDNAEMPWGPAVTSRTRVYGSPSWLAATTKHNLRRALKRTLGSEVEERKQLEDVIAISVLDAADDLQLFDKKKVNFLDADDLRREEKLPQLLVIGTMDKCKTSCFIC